ncbi:MAG: chitobiase/beta-hexosaminidase C-terminal domain-containing protein [Thermoanaerobacterales bacterium]|nr:chitobiase/beta-hexosaminidase C-terminal domain-containing protein [Thermoanaerobacterales bacterium]
MAPLRTCNAHPGWGQRGFTLVEVLVALMILTVLTLAFIPLFVYISEGSQANRARLVATKLAAGVIEEIRALDYEQVGTVGGNPEGSIPQLQTKQIEGINYTIETRIWWVQGSDSNVTAYKKVQVTVKAPDALTGEVVDTAVLGSLVAREGEKTIVQAGEIKAEVRWRDSLKENVKIDVTCTETQTGWTDEEGSVIFGELPAGTYSVAASYSEMMVKPVGVTGQIWKTVRDNMLVENWKTTPVYFDVEWPVQLALTLRDADGNPVSPECLTATLKPEGEEFALSCSLATLAELDLWPGWTYDLEIKDLTGDKYIRSQNPSEWDGNFSLPSSPTTVRKTLTVKVGMPVADPTPGIVPEGAAIALTALPADAAIHYSVDGTDPTTESTLYDPDNKPVIPSGGLTIKAIAVKDGMLSSDVVVFQYSTPAP